MLVPRASTNVVSNLVPMQAADFMNDEKTLEELCKQGAQWLLELDTSSPHASEKLHDDRVTVCIQVHVVSSGKCSPVLSTWTPDDKDCHARRVYTHPERTHSALEDLLLARTNIFL